MGLFNSSASFAWSYLFSCFVRLAASKLFGSFSACGHSVWWVCFASAMVAKGYKATPEIIWFTLCFTDTSQYNKCTPLCYVETAGNFHSLHSSLTCHITTSAPPSNMPRILVNLNITTGSVGWIPDKCLLTILPSWCAEGMEALWNFETGRRQQC